MVDIPDDEDLVDYDGDDEEPEEELEEEPKQQIGHEISLLNTLTHSPLERGCNTDNVHALRQLALKDEHGFVIHLGSRLH
nr:hypothetical protein [Tanacetum cinerariifolium]